jgi:hypothetical protein
MATNFFKRASSSQLFQNVFSNYASVVWMGLLSLGLIPVYLRVLGPEQWGIVAICMAIQGFMGLLDAGLGQIMPRDMALASADKARQAHVFALFSRSYMMLGLIGFVVGQLAVPYLIAHWFNNGQGLAEGTEWVLRLVIAQFFFQFSNNAHAGYWNGLQEQKTANLRLCFFGTLKHMGALAMVSLWSPHALSYLLPFTVVAALEWWLNRRSVRQELGDAHGSPLVWHDFQTLAHNAGLLAAGVLVGMVVSQMDRIVLSRTLDAATYGSYVIVANLGLAFMQLQYPLMRAFFPRVVGGFGDGAVCCALFAGCSRCPLGAANLAVQPENGIGRGRSPASDPVRRGRQCSVPSYLPAHCGYRRKPGGHRDQRCCDDHNCPHALFHRTSLWSCRWRYGLVPVLCVATGIGRLLALAPKKPVREKNTPT